MQPQLRIHPYSIPPPQSGNDPCSCLPLPIKPSLLSRQPPSSCQRELKLDPRGEAKRSVFSRRSHDLGVEELVSDPAGGAR